MKSGVSRSFQAAAGMVEGQRWLFSVVPHAYRCISLIKTSLHFALEVWELEPESPNSHRRGVGGFRIPLETVTFRLGVALEIYFFARDG